MKKVLVTGAAGFLGGWIVESFHLAGLPVRAGVRRWSSASRLTRRSLEVVLCDVLSVPQLREAMSGCDAVVHCAVGDDDVTVTGTRNVVTAAVESRLKRIVHLSSVAVYGNASGLIDEDHPRNGRGNAYAQRKIAAEQVCEPFIGQDAPVVTLRPTIIYGPFSYTWTVSFANRLWSGQWGTFGNSGEGTCNLVYVSDVVQAVARALQSERAIGETFNINGSELISWNEYFERFNEALGRPPLPSINSLPMVLKSRLMAPVRLAGRVALSRFNRTLMNLNAKSSLAARYMRATESSLKLTPTADQLAMYGRKVEFPIDRAREKLGYEPAVGVSQGLGFSAQWLRQNNLLF